MPNPDLSNPSAPPTYLPTVFLAQLDAPVSSLARVEVDGDGIRIFLPRLPVQDK